MERRADSQEGGHGLGCVRVVRNLGGVSPGWVSPGMRTLSGAGRIYAISSWDRSVVDDARAEGTGEAVAR